MTSPTAAISFDARTRVPDGVLFRELEGESVILSLDSETYFGLDAVGTRFWTALGSAPSIEAAFETLCGEYDVAPEQLRRDLEELLGELVARKLLEIHGP